jgi:cytidylate kinase
MKTTSEFEHCLSFINCTLTPGQVGSEVKPSGLRRRAITVSRQSGSGGSVIAKALAAFLDVHAPREGCPWTVFDRNLVERVLQDHNLPQRLSKFMAEDRISEISDIMDELFGLHPSSWVLVRQTSETILHLAELGNVILLGRGTSVITAKLDNVFHVRLVGSLERRVERIMEAQSLDHGAAVEHIKNEDRGRTRYLKTYFDRDIDDPLLYDLVINTDRVPLEAAAKMIGEAMLHAESNRCLAV